jgi:uncharacterized Zn-finger protein
MSNPRTPLADQAASSERPSLIQLSAKDLNPQGGVYCPSPKAHMQLWNTHPKVYLDVAKSGVAKCPYCGTTYKLKAGEVVSHGH